MASFTLFEDQSHDVDQLRKLVRDHRRVVYQLSTGGGKTIVAGHIIQSARSKGRRILVLVHRRELARQFLGTLQEAGLAEDIGMLCGGYAASPWASIQIAMVMTWARRWPPFNPHMIVIDECHHARAESWHKVIKRYPRAALLGLTATPKRLDGKGLSPLFSAMHCGLSTPALIEAGRLCPVRVLRVNIGFNGTGVRTTGGDYNRGDLDSKADAKVVGDSVAAYLKYIPGLRTILFAVTKRHARVTAERFNELGIAAAAVGDDTPQEVRDRTFLHFAEGRITVVCNVALVDEGFDVPACQAVIDAAPTRSETRYLQRCGRMMRVSPEEPDKVGILLDLCGNTWRHDLPDSERNWELSIDSPAEARKENQQRGESLRHCQACKAVFRSGAVCPHCGHEHDGRPVREVEVELVEAQPKPAAPKPKQTRQQRASLTRYCADLVRRGQAQDAWLELLKHAKQNGYQLGWCHLTANLINLPKQHRQPEYTESE